MRSVHKREDAKRKGLASLEGVAGQRITIGSLLGGGVATQGLYCVQLPPYLRSFLNYFRPIAPVGAPKRQGQGGVGKILTRESALKGLVRTRIQ